MEEKIETSLDNAESRARETKRAIKAVHDYTRPSLLNIPKKSPMFNYRWLRNTPESIALMEAKGYKVANGDQVRQAGLTPREDGTARVGDLILGVEDIKHHIEHRNREAFIRKRRQDMLKRGVRKNVRSGGFTFDQTEREG